MRFTMPFGHVTHDRRLAGGLVLGAVLLSATGVAAATASTSVAAFCIWPT